MALETKQEILDVLTMPEAAFWAEVAPEARRTCQAHFGDTLLVTAMLAYTNICKNQCLYCGMRAGSKIPRYRMLTEEILPLAQRAREAGLGRMFLLAGEDLHYGFDNLLTLVSGLRQQGFTIALGAGEFSRAQYQALHDAGVEEYVLKFEMSHPDSFQRLNPSTTYAKRLGCARWIREAGMKLASGNIVDWPGQTLDELADDILLMKELEISWAPNIPYLPAANTPLAQEGGPGELSAEQQGDGHPPPDDAGDQDHRPAAGGEPQKTAWPTRRETSTPSPAGQTSSSATCCRTPRPTPSAPLTSGTSPAWGTARTWPAWPA